MELAEHAAETAHPLLEARPQMWSAKVEDMTQHGYPRMVPLMRIVAHATAKPSHQVERPTEDQLGYRSGPRCNDIVKE